jgi:two-component system, NarL family, sensor histidine kinase UhpB
VVLLVSLLAAIVCVKFDVSESIGRWTRPHERLQLDELPGVLLVVAVCMAWFASRRYFEANRELKLRKAAESRLAEALAENQQLALKYVDMQEAERRALARDLHDELGQYVNAIKLDAVAMRDAAAPSRWQAMIANIDRVYHVLGGLIRQLRPAGFDELGVTAAIEHCVEEWRSRLPATLIELSVGDLSVDESHGMVIFRLVQESLTNIARHSSATRVRILIERTDQGIEVVIADNGRGADLSLPRAGLGLIGMRERVASLGGSIALSGGAGEGFTVKASLPLGPHS